eukprot:COSAG01_NODE_58817_length_303_cov_2.975490_1_plen_53_part_01
MYVVRRNKQGNSFFRLEDTVEGSANYSSRRPKQKSRKGSGWNKGARREKVSNC